MSVEHWQWLGWYMGFPVLSLSIALTTGLRQHGWESWPYRGTDALRNFGRALAFLGFWPVFAAYLIYVAVHAAIQYEARSVAGATNAACQRRHLVAKVTIQEAEEIGSIVDPLHRVPDLPFGHLNATWLAFLSKKQFGYGLHSFAVSEKSLAGMSKTQCAKRGFAWVRLGVVKAEFTCEWGV
jgi:hypothetical protein